MLKINKLNVEVDGKLLLKDLSLEVPDKSVKALIGPNGSGKSSLAYTIAGHPKYKVISGSVSFNGKNLLKMPPSERAKLGIFLMFQSPPEIQGVTLKTVLEDIFGKDLDIEKVKSILNSLNLKPELLQRDFNKGFSGGEKKKIEMLQVELLKPKLAILDEPDSGVDSDSIKIIANKINELNNQGTSFLIISHQSKLFSYLSLDGIYVMKDRSIVAEGNSELIQKIEVGGYGNL